MKQFLLDNYSLITKAFEIIAAVFGSIYLSKTKDTRYKIFVNYLWLTVAVEFIGEYTAFLQNNYDNEWYNAIKNSVFCRNTWLFNIYTFLSIGLLGIFYSRFFSSKISKAIIRFVVLGYSLFVLIYFTATDAFFVMSLPYDEILGTVIICTYILLYFMELIKSDSILVFYKTPLFYISVSLLFWYICVTPLFIFNGYFRAINTDFVIFRYLLLLLINVITFLCVTFGFWYSLYKRKL
ncbi:hypothetical protein [Ichthyenterobacterium magnum]|uniref:Bacteriorhodopsin-like protein n=1 Tax=Ichthyenterobacterium magnum TaxID=1230530 RepID=A0A420DLJ3_9FLAO|nr:hypothetical protein [Ichthyenterobacterium magnum]RKE95156.1 hypothetical protein BXY80_1341 [Ichthyenterobacterium magnum]